MTIDRDRAIGDALSDVLAQTHRFDRLGHERQAFADGESEVDVHSYQFQVNLAADALLRAAEIRVKEEGNAQASP